MRTALIVEFRNILCAGSIVAPEGFLPPMQTAGEELHEGVEGCIVPRSPPVHDVGEFVQQDVPKCTVGENPVVLVANTQKDTFLVERVGAGGRGVHVNVTDYGAGFVAKVRGYQQKASQRGD